MDKDILALIALEIKRLATSGVLSADDMILLYACNPDYIKMYTLLMSKGSNPAFNLLKMMLTTYVCLVNKSKSGREIISMIQQVRDMYNEENKAG
ncbi:hypothetical protein [Komagataeibacter nataicola]|uniref:Uncharacterized protein n=1 Tax=Komagataeibacter nataicola TaxID=265960 RepID=A0ABX5PD37_9PROT|nr:hypothetical protein [Komagataeibacter nataicola]PYD65232.1 hypothetical protein CDI09_14670 [Komagataeibacter nataicola]WNM07307.1 hypothetical protein RI056_00250 [Komagataeibacter nataicola]